MFAANRALPHGEPIAMDVLPSDIWHHLLLSSLKQQREAEEWGMSGQQTKWHHACGICASGSYF